MYFPANFDVGRLDWYKALAREFLKQVAKEKDKKSLKYRDIMHELFKHQELWSRAKRGEFPSKWKLNLVMRRYFKDVMASELGEVIGRLLVKTKTRSLSGIVPVSVFTKGKGCGFDCVYCPTAGNDDVPKSYFPDEAAVQRAIRFDFDPYLQMEGRLVMFYLSGHVIDKVDLIIQGGTFSFYDKKYREWFVKRCFDGANSDVIGMIEEGKRSQVDGQGLVEAQERNEKALSRIVGVTIETRPDYIDKGEIRFLRHLGVTRVELGVQIVDDRILSLIKRGHGLEDVKRATYLLKESGFKVAYHLMTNLPGSSPEHDLAKLKEVFADSDYRPDYLKVYPTALAKNSELLRWYQQGRYKPYSQKELIPILIEFKEKVVPEYVRIQRLVRDLTKADQEVVLVESHLRQKLHMAKVKCRCVRCREVGGDKLGRVWLKVFGYKASRGIEYFLSFVDKDGRLYGLLRLRILAGEDGHEWQAVVRELHVYGKAVKVGGGGEGLVQHKGLGVKLMEAAEEIAKRHKVKRLAVISGVGVREYYRKLGYRLDKGYMVKELLGGALGCEAF